MQIITAAQVLETLDLTTCMELMKKALIALSGGEAKQIVRPVLPLYDYNVLGMMPAYYGPGQIAGVKVLSVFPENYRKNISSHQGQVLVFETKTGQIKAAVDADSLTGVRTAAVSAVVTDYLARSDAKNLAILGAGLQGRKHLEALALVRDLHEVTVWDLQPEASRRYAREMGEKLGLQITACQSVDEATKNADLICTLTPAQTPILFEHQVKDGTHINAVGACSPTARELSAELMARGKLYVDWKPATLVEAGDYLLAVEDGAITEEHILGEVGDVLVGNLSGRENSQEVTIFEALGQATQDLILANYVAENVI